STLQLDSYLPTKFNLYSKINNTKRNNITVIHHSYVGTIERLISMLLFKNNGILPLKLAPVQVYIACLSEKNTYYCNFIHLKLLKDNIRTELNVKDEKMNKKVKKAILKRVNYIVAAGKKEQDDQTISYRT